MGEWASRAIGSGEGQVFVTLSKISTSGGTVAFVGGNTLSDASITHSEPRLIFAWHTIVCRARRWDVPVSTQMDCFLDLKSERQTGDKDPPMQENKPQATMPQSSIPSQRQHQFLPTKEKNDKRKWTMSLGSGQYPVAV
jgi:hypothetical protein